MDPEEIADLLEQHWTPNPDGSMHECLCQYLKQNPAVAKIIEFRIEQRRLIRNMGHA